MPLIWRDHPEIECLLVGSGMPARMRGLARPGLVAQGEVSDLAEVFDRVRLTVAPLRFGAGLKGKVLESLGAGVPCVMSRVAAEGMVLPAALSALVADGADALAVRIATLHGSAAQHQAAAAAGVRLIAEGFTANRVAEALSAAIGLRATARSASG
jgi:glycosyltransferase involved in cell wall biosynthesis